MDAMKTRAETQRSASCVSLLLACGCVSMTFPKSNHCDGNTFFNTDPNANVTKGAVDLLRWQLGGGRTGWPEFSSRRSQAQLPAQVAPDAVHVTFINHATELVQL